MCNRLDSIPACERLTDGQTDILPRHSPRYAYASRGKKSNANNEHLLTALFLEEDVFVEVGY